MFTMDKKAISQLISFVLLIGFAVAMAAIITTWSIEQVKKVEFDKENIKELCKDVRLDISGACRTLDGQKVTLRLENPGYFDISFATVGRETANIPEAWCLDLNFNLTTNLSNRLINYTINGIFLNANFDEDFNQFTECKNLGGGVISEPIDSFTIVPWIRINDQSIPCTDKKAIISEQNMICNCSGNFTCPND